MKNNKNKTKTKAADKVKYIMDKKELISKGCIIINKNNILTCIPNNWVIVQNPVVNEKSKKIIGTYSYYSRLEHALNDILEIHLKKIKAKEIQDIKKDILIARKKTKKLGLKLEKYCSDTMQIITECLGKTV